MPDRPPDRDDHRDYEDLAVKHVMGGLGSVEASTFRSHLMDCEECRARVGELRTIANDLAAVERDERRERAASQVETKRRAETTPVVEDELDVPQPSRLRPFAIAGVVLIVLLSSWNFTLRGQVDGLRGALDAERTSMEVMNFGAPWETAIEGVGITGAARSSEDRLALMLDGTDDDVVYRVAIFDADGDLQRAETVISVDGRLRFLAARVSDGAQRVDVTEPRSDDASTIVFRASAPAAD